MKGMQVHEFILNFVSCFAHELMHIAGINSEVEIARKEFQVAEEFLGHPLSDQQKAEVIRDAEASESPPDGGS
jgi:hypothetical protein